MVRGGTDLRLGCRGGGGGDGSFNNAALLLELSGESGGPVANLGRRGGGSSPAPPKAPDIVSSRSPL